MNQAILIGHLGKDPEVKTLEGGTSVATFSIATSKRWKDKDGNPQESTQWHNIVAWRGLATLAQGYMKKGTQVCIQGEIQTRQYEHEGQTRYITEIVAERIELLGGKPQGNTAPAPSVQDAPPASKDKDDLPF